jgi:hypothetical protein
MNSENSNNIIILCVCCRHIANSSFWRGVRWKSEPFSWHTKIFFFFCSAMFWYLYNNTRLRRRALISVKKSVLVIHKFFFFRGGCLCNHLLHASIENESKGEREAERREKCVFVYNPDLSILFSLLHNAHDFSLLCMKMYMEKEGEEYT